MTTTATPHSQSRSSKRVPRGPLRAGYRAPDFKLKCSQYRYSTLEDYQGSPLVVAFYVADWHPVCSVQLARYSDIGPQLIRMRAQLVTISTDTVWSHAAFADAHRLPFPLLADDQPRGNTARAYGVYDVQRQAAKRALFVIDAMGSITWSAVFPDAVDPGADGILTALEKLNRTPPTEVPPA